MAKTSLSAIGFCGAMLFGFAVHAADTWFVKAANFGKEGLDGRTEETAWGTLQDAHDNAAAGDTIKVLEGVYDKGQKYESHHTNRLVVTKKLFFKAVGSRDSTHIVGKIATVKVDGTPSTNGIGSDGMRCVCITADGYGSQFSGFTFRDGASSDSGSDPMEGGTTASGGGAINVLGAARNYSCQNVFFVDCVISNSFAVWGGAMRGGTAIRCLIVNNGGSSFGGTCCSAGLWNSVIVGSDQFSSDRPACGNYCRIVNSTIAATASTGYNRYGECYNTLFTSCKSTAMQNNYSNLSYNNCTNTLLGVYSPATFDFRPVKGLEADGNGKTSYITEKLPLPEGIEMKDFNGNPIDLAKETCDIGAVQGAVKAAGAVILPVGTLVDGKAVPLYKTTYARSVDWPRALVIKPTIERFFSFEASGDCCGGPMRRFLQLDGTYHMIPPPFSNQTITLENKIYNHEYWCSPNADASVATGAEDKPFRTVQEAIVAATNAMLSVSEPAVVNLLPGEYREGGAFGHDHNNRIVIPSGKSFLIRSTAGAEDTIVYGQADDTPKSGDECYAKCGPKAMRCVSATGDAVSALQGITFVDGHSNYASSTDNVESDCGGGLHLGSHHQVLDCIVRGCTAVRGGIGYYGRFMRCRFYDSVSYSGVFRYGVLAACYIDGTCREGPKPTGNEFSNVSVVGSLQHAFLCTMPVTYNNARSVYSCLLGKQYIYNIPQYGSVYLASTGVKDNAHGFAVRDPRYVDYDNGDLRVMTGTPAASASASALATCSAEEIGLWVSNITAYAQSDVDGNRLKLVDGNLMPGCFHDTVDGVWISADKGSVSVGDAPLGKVVEVDNLPVVAEMVNGSYPCIGFAVNGVTNRFDDAKDLKITFSAADVAAVGGGIFAEAIYTKDWYADPNGDDANCGFTPRSAKKTLAAAMAMTRDGDTVHAAEGRYEDGYGSLKQVSEDPDSRIFIPTGRSLVADGDVGKTFIVGQRGTDRFTDDIGCGSNSVRCVYMAAGTLLKGFTLVDGCAYPSNGQSGDYGKPFNSGAILGARRETCIVQDCVISNCAAYNSAAGREVSFVNCLITGNKAKRGITSECYHFSCVIDGNYANVATLHLHTRVVDTTIGPNAFKLNGSDGVALGFKSTDSARIVNSLILGKCNTGELKNTVSNCVFAAGMGTTVSITNNSWNCRFANADELQVDENLRPIAGRNVACDIADAEVGDGLDKKLMDIYMSLRSRANNGNRLDAGALEADWRGRYAEDVGGYRFSVSAADNSVEESRNRTVLVPDGATLSGGWNNGSGRSRTYLVRFKVPESGALSIDVDGSVETFSEGIHEYRFVSSMTDVPVRFASMGGTSEIMCGGWIRGTIMVIR